MCSGGAGRGSNEGTDKEAGTVGGRKKEEKRSSDDGLRREARGVRREA